MKFSTTFFVNKLRLSVLTFLIWVLLSVNIFTNAQGYGGQDPYGINAGAFPRGVDETVINLCPTNINGSYSVQNPISSLQSIEFIYSERVCGDIEVKVSVPSAVPTNGCVGKNCLYVINVLYKNINKSVLKIRFTPKLFDSVTAKFTNLRARYFNSPGIQTSLTKTGSLGNGLTGYLSFAPAFSYYAIDGVILNSTIRTGGINILLVASPILAIIVLVFLYSISRSYAKKQIER